MGQVLCKAYGETTSFAMTIPEISGFRRKGNPRRDTRF
jgi:hypothetical protein